MSVVRMELVDVDQMPKVSVQRLVDEPGEILGSEDGHTWLTIVPIPADHYAENRVVDAARTCRPVFVEAQRRDRSKTMEAEASGVAAVVAAILGRSRENIHITFSEPLADDAETDALWAKFAESINRAQKNSNHPVETLQAMSVALAALGEGVRQMLL